MGGWRGVCMSFSKREESFSFLVGAKERKRHQRSHADFITALKLVADWKYPVLNTVVISSDFVYVNTYIICNTLHLTITDIIWNFV